jgi:long-chain acyl-CoA synthetase
MNISYLLDRQAGLAPQRTAMLLEDGGSRSWAETRDRVDRLAGGLRDLGAAKGERIAILALNGPHYLEASWAAARLGAILQTMNMRLSPPELAQQVADAGPKLMLVSPELGALGDAAAPELPKIALSGAMGSGATGPGSVEDLIASAKPVAALTPLAPDDTLAIFYTSGTTGTPKGVMITHQNILANSAFLLPVIGYAADDITLHAAPMFHVSDFCASFAQLLAGGSHAFLPRFAPDALPAAVERYKATNLILIPAMINALVRDPAVGKHDLSSWRLLFYGGAPISEDLLRRCFAQLPCGLAQGYGQTEATHTVCVLTEDDHRRALDEPHLLSSCGRPLIGVEARVVDDDGGVLPPDAIGEVIVRAPNVMKGYWNQPKATAETVRDGWLHTGDLGRFDAEGYLTLVDRKKDMIVSGGENVYSAEVENAMAGHPAVVEAAAIAVPDDKMGERVHAVVVLAEGAAASEADLREHCRATVAGFKLPRTFEFTDALPKTAAGKVRKAELRAPHWAGSDRLVG